MGKIIARFSRALSAVKYFVRYGVRSPFEYRRREMLDEERRAMREQVDKEATQFLAEVGNTPPWAWDPGTQAWYESLRRREAESS